MESVRDTKVDAKKEIADALTGFRRMVSFKGGEFETLYRLLAAKLDDSEDAAQMVHKRIDDVEYVAEVHFEEWREELGQHSSSDLRAKSEQQFTQTQPRYGQMIGAMKRAECRREPALRRLRDQVLLLKHNLNAQAMAGLKGQVMQVDAQVNSLVTEVDRAVAEANRFMAELEGGG